LERPFAQIEVETHGDVFCVRLRNQRVDEKGLEELGAEISRLVDEKDGRKLVLNLGPEDPHCLYSVFLAKLVNLQRRLKSNGGSVVLANLSPETRNIFQVCGLERLFKFEADQDAAIASFGPV